MTPHGDQYRNQRHEQQDPVVRLWDFDNWRCRRIFLVADAVIVFILFANDWRIWVGIASPWRDDDWREYNWPRWRRNDRQCWRKDGRERNNRRTVDKRHSRAERCCYWRPPRSQRGCRVITGYPSWNGAGSQKESALAFLGSASFSPQHPQLTTMSFRMSPTALA